MSWCRCKSQADLQALLDTVVSEGVRLGIKINVRKTKCMVISKNDSSALCMNLSVGLDQIEQVKQFVYLGSLITSDGRCDAEIRRRVEIARKSFNSMKSLFCNKSLSFSIRMRMVQCYVLSTLYYAAVKRG